MALTLEEQNKVRELKQKGFSNTQIMGHIASTRRGMPSAISEELGETPDKEVQKEISYGQKIIDVNAAKLRNRADQFSANAERFSSGQQGLAETAVQQAGTALAAGVIDPVSSVVENTPGVRRVFETVGRGINALATSKYSPIKYIGDFFGNSEKLQDAVTLYDTDPQFKQTVDSTANMLNAAATIQGGVSAGTGITNTSIRAGQQGLRFAGQMGEATLRTADEAFQSGQQLAQQTKGVISGKLTGKNIDPQIKTSAERMVNPNFLKGTTQRIQNPVSLYDDYLAQSKKAITDTKIDPAISQVGSEIGDSFKSVVQQRKNVGKVLSSELEKVKDIQTNTLPVTDTLVSDLRANGLVYDRVTKTIKPVSSQVKIGASDQKLLESYAQELQNLGTKPTVGEIDSFISRVNDDIKIYKSTNNIIGTSNTERLIIKSLSDLRNTLTKTAGAGYTEARAAYSQLSNFISEGEKYLGKLTQSGDFAKDASLAKNSVQSILNNGKKDWLIELETLTGNPLLDKTVLALQAMKDAGDFRGVSLLEVLSEGSVPKSKIGVLQKIIDYGLSKVGEAVVGSPEEQTRAFLNSLLEQQ